MVPPWGWLSPLHDGADARPDRRAALNFMGQKEWDAFAPDSQRIHRTGGLGTITVDRRERDGHLGRTTEEALRREFAAGDEFLIRARDLLVEDRGPQDIVLGRHLLARGLEPSPRFRELLDRCREVQDETGASDPNWILDQVLDPAAGDVGAG